MATLESGASPARAVVLPPVVLFAPRVLLLAPLQLGWVSVPLVLLLPLVALLPLVLLLPEGVPLPWVSLLIVPLAPRQLPSPVPPQTRTLILLLLVRVLPSVGLLPL